MQYQRFRNIFRRLIFKNLSVPIQFRLDNTFILLNIFRPNLDSLREYFRRVLLKLFLDRDHGLTIRVASTFLEFLSKVRGGHLVVTVLGDSSLHTFDLQVYWQLGD